MASRGSSFDWSKNKNRFSCLEWHKTKFHNINVNSEVNFVCITMYEREWNGRRKEQHLKHFWCDFIQRKDARARAKTHQITNRMQWISLLLSYSTTKLWARQTPNSNNNEMCVSVDGMSEKIFKIEFIRTWKRQSVKYTEKKCQHRHTDTANEYSHTFYL